jgi:lactose/L-arabinose transport system substrate-binding protein
MKKSLLLVFAVLILVAATAFTGCKGGSTGGSKQVTIWAWDPNFNIAIMEEAKQRYLKLVPDAEITVVDIAKGDLEQKLHTMLASGVKDGLPDIVLIEDYNAQKYLQSYPGSFADLTGKINHKDFLQYKVDLMTVKGKVYGVPFDTGASAMYYRTDILAKAGYSAKDLENITWDQFIEIGKVVKAKTGKAIVAFDPNDGGLMRIMMQSAGKWYFDANGKVDIANNAALEETMLLYKKIMDSKITKLTSGWGEWVGSFNNGDTACVVTGVWITGSVKAAADQSGKWAVAPTPRLSLAGSVNASNLGGSSWYVLEASKSKKTAIDFLAQIYGKDVDFYQKILVDRGAVGSFIPSQSGSAYSQPDPFFGGQKVFADFGKWMQEIPGVNYGMYSYEADNIIMSKMADVVAGKDVKEVLKEIDTQVASQIK